MLHVGSLLLIFEKHYRKLPNFGCQINLIVQSQGMEILKFLETSVRSDILHPSWSYSSSKQVYVNFPKSLAAPRSLDLYQFGCLLALTI